ncbi:MAG: pirin family protein [Proteobacteria bacterium]|nr:MAG: pirin family protein [Pseudomonadota bacterium]
MVGPFIFFDHMGPAVFAPGQGLDVRPHPHINLATVTYLFSGSIFHRDHLGSAQLIEPGAINWMTAGSGIVHSERSAPEVRKSGGPLHGIQLWVALPKEHEEIAPSFTHHPAASIPDFEENGSRVRLLVGEAFGRLSPERGHSDLIYLEARIPGGRTLKIPSGKRDLAAYIVGGAALVNGAHIQATSMAIGHPGGDLEITAAEDSHIMVFGGSPFPEQRLIWWNFVARTRERIEEAQTQWREGRFPKIPGDEAEFIPLPDDPLPANPKGTIL